MRSFVSGCYGRFSEGNTYDHPVTPDEGVVRVDPVRGWANEEPAKQAGSFGSIVLLREA